MPHKISVTFM